MTPLLSLLVAQVPALRLPQVDYFALLPEIVMAGMAFVTLGARSLTRRGLPPAVWTLVTMATGLASGTLAVLLGRRVETHGAFAAVDGALAVDGFSVLFLVLVSAAVVLFALAAHPWIEREGEDGAELLSLGMLSASGAMFMAAANDLLVIFLGLEILSIALYVLAALNRRRAASGEAAIKYFVLGAFSSAIFLYGIALTYGATGSTNLARIGTYLAANVSTHGGLLLAGLALLLVGLGFKVAAVPFHTWTPDVYQGSPSPVTGFMAAVAKAGGFAALVRILFAAMPTLRLDWQPVLYALAVLSLVVGAILAVVQRDVKRMLAYSSISHAGFILVGVVAASAAGAASVGYYLLTYTFLIMGSFAVVTVVGGPADAHQDLEDYRGLARRQPLLALGFAILLVAQAGVPFTTGFLAKFYVLTAVIAQGGYVLAVIAMLAAVAVAFFYLRLVLVMYGWAGAGAGAGAGAVGPVGDADAAGAGEVVLPAGTTSLAGVGAGGGGEPDLAVLGGGGGLALATATSTGVEQAISGEGLVAAPEGLAAGDGDPVPFPDATKVVLALCVAFTVVFGIWPAPVVDFARHATLLFGLR
jgi:NADH-quinone oxidoreductase subunit N